jgi:hypothetical protein
VTTRATALAVLAALLATGAVLASPNNVDGSSSTGPSATPGAGNATSQADTQTTASIKEGPKLVFDHVEAEYASRFTVHMDNASQGGWGRALSGDAGILEVTYGVLRYWSGDNATAVGGEAFLKVEGPNGARRFLANSGSWTYWNDTWPGVVRTAKLEFSSDKQVVNGTIVKDFTPPVYSVHLWRAFNETTGDLDELMIATWDDWPEGFDAFWKGRPTNNTWSLVPATFIEAGLPTVGVRP